MPRRKLVKPPDEALDAIKAAHKKGRPIPDEESVSILSRAFRLAPISDMPTGTVVRKGKAGEGRFWVEGHLKGPGLTEPPLARKLQKLERDFLAGVTKRFRRPPTEAAAQARRDQSKRPSIAQAWLRYGLDSRGVAKRIAAEQNVSPAYVRKIRAQMRQSEGT